MSALPVRETPAIMAVVEVVRRHPQGIRATALAQTLGLQPETVRNRLTVARRLGLVNLVGHTNHARWVPVTLATRARVATEASTETSTPEPLALPDDPILAYTEQLLDALKVPSDMPLLMRLAYALGRLTKEQL